MAGRIQACTGLKKKLRESFTFISHRSIRVFGSYIPINLICGFCTTLVGHEFNWTFEKHSQTLLFLLKLAIWNETLPGRGCQETRIALGKNKTKFC